METLYIKNRYILSNWILILCILFYFKVINYNPIIMLYISILFCIIQINIYIYYNIKYNYLIKYIILIFIIHLVPVLFIYNRKINYKYDIMVSIIIVIIYYLFNLYNNQSIISNYRNLLLYDYNKSQGIPSHNNYIFEKYIYKI
jgi:hypothetical protein